MALQSDAGQLLKAGDVAFEEKGERQGEMLRVIYFREKFYGHPPDNEGSRCPPV
jgi:hypothetical protein